MNKFLKALDDFTKKPVNDLSTKEGERKTEERNRRANKVMKKTWKKLW